MPVIFPSLSRAPQFSSTRKVEDGTLRDPMESGAVAARPRFTRLRRTFGVSYNYLTAEDVRALDKFETQTVQGGAGSFYMPNLIPNGSFELSDNSGGIAGWDPNPGPLSMITLSLNADDGAVALLFTTNAVGIGNGAYLQSVVASSCLIPVTAGEVYQLCARVNASTPSLPAGITPQFFVSALLNYSDGSTGVSNVDVVTEPTAGYQSEVAMLAVPASSSGATQATAEIQLVLRLTNATGSLINVPAGAVTQLVDSVGMALASSPQPYGRMPGSSPLVSAVRLSEKGIQIRDTGIAGGEKTYAASFEVTEI